MKIYVGITDNDWFRFLRSLPDLDEVNFWQPGGTHQFRALQVGELFLFKLHSPENVIAGGGFFTHTSLLPTSLAWEAFGEKNGATSLDEVRRRVEKYRRTQTDPHQDYTIGCIILQDPFFFDDRDFIPVPDDFHPNIVQGKGYDTTSENGRALWEAVRIRLQVPQRDQVADPAPMYGEPALVRQRLGQGAFRVLVTDTYERRCAITQEKALPALEAAHIRPVAEKGMHRIDNGLLLRSDIHRLFDSGYVTITPDYKFQASHRLKDDFHNGEEYLRLSGSGIWLPRGPDNCPNREFLEWHSDTVFRG